ncbi:MAG: CesT family type III secretion system chaperone [Chlamydiales bacterium]
MNPFEDLIKDLGSLMDLPLKPDNNQSCLMNFYEIGVSVQIDLDTNADKILIGSLLGALSAGPYRERIFKQALRVNGLSTSPRGTLAYSTKNDTLVLFQFLPLAYIDGKKLFNFLQLFIEHARAWIEAIKQGDIPPIEEDR